MPTHDTLRVCPFCGNTLDLRQCDIVSTYRGLARSGGTSSFDSDEVETTTVDTSLPVLVPRPVVVAPKSGWEGVLGAVADTTLKPVLSVAPVERMPRRQCPDCKEPLPLEMDDRDAHVLAIAGLNGSGKSHYIAAAVNDALHRSGLRRFAVQEFTPLEDTAKRFHTDYFTPVFRNRRLLASTQVDERVARKPLMFGVTVEGCDPIVLMTHDVSGETLSDHRDRAAVAPFLRRASALVFLLDPVEFDEVRERVPSSMLPTDRSIHQVDLLRACLTELEQLDPSGREVPVCIVISKADVLSTYCDISGPWQSQPQGTLVEDIQDVNDAVKDALKQLGEQEILDIADARGRVTFHAVSALGAPDGLGTTGSGPLRCADPLGTSLVRMARR